MIDRNGKDIDFSELFMEETLSAKDKKNIPDDQWGLLIRNEKGEIIERKFPLNDERHVKQAAIMFNRAKGLTDDQKRELARNIVRRAKELNMDYSGWESLKPYLGKGKNVQEQYMTFEWLDKHFGPNDETTGTTDFDEKDDFSDESLNEGYSLSDLLGPIITEAYDAVTGKEIPIERAYSLEEMKDITFSNEEAIDERGIQKYLKSAKDTAKKIHDAVERDSKPPTGNQNCLLCTWCSEAAFRGAIKYPRPVYSPRDPVLSIPGESIVHEPRKLSIRGFDNLLEHLMDAEQPFARFYIHVNWEGSNGGHEFLILRVAPNRYYVMDSQSGMVDPLTDEHSYFKNINWDNSYICRLDNKNFNYRLFDKMNDPKITLAWNPDKDIPYMLDNGMITKEEAERELKHAETMEFYKELKKALGQTPVQESATGVSNIKLRPATEKDLDQILKWETATMNKVYREDKKLLEKMRKEDKENLSSIKIITSDGKDIGMYQAYPIDEGEWWYIAEIYLIPQYRGQGIGSSLLRKDISKHDKLVLRVDPDNKKAMKLYKSLGFTVTKREKFSWIMRLDKTKRSKKAICEGMVQYLSEFKYGLAENGKVHSASAHDYDTKYKLQSPEEFEHNGGGICYDYVEFMEDYLKSLGVKCKKYYISTDSDDNMTHTFILVEDGKDNFIYPEASFKLLEGVHEVKYPEVAIAKIMDEIYRMHGEKPIKYYAWEYSGHPSYGSDIKTCMKYFTKGEPIMDGTIENKKRKD